MNKKFHTTVQRVIYSFFSYFILSQLNLSRISLRLMNILAFLLNILAFLQSSAMTLYLSVKTSCSELSHPSIRIFFSQSLTPPSLQSIWQSVSVCLSVCSSPRFNWEITSMISSTVMSASWIKSCKSIRWSWKQTTLE